MPFDIDLAGSLLTVLVGLPLAGALIVFLMPQSRENAAQWVAVSFSLAELCLGVLLLVRFQAYLPGYQFTQHIDWMPELGIAYRVGVDGLSVLLIVLTSLLSALVVIAAPSVREKRGAYLGCLLFLEAGMVGVFCALDLVLFYVFWEAMLIPMYLLIGIWGGERRVYAALKFVLFTAIGSLLMLAAIIYLGYRYEQQFGMPSFYLSDWSALQLGLREEVLLFGAFALAFAIKIPVVPLHSWLPDAHVEAPAGGSVILAGVLLKMGLYGLIRFCVPVFPEACAGAGPLFVVLGVIGIVFGALVAWVQDDVKKLVAYSSISHLGFCVLGFGVFNVWGLKGAMLQMLNHGISTGALFFLVGVLYDRAHSRRIADFGGLAQKMPLFAFVFLSVSLSSIALPLTNGFVGEFLILFGAYRFQPYAAVAAVSGVVLGAVYMLSAYRRLMFGDFMAPNGAQIHDLNRREKIVFVPLLALVLVIGVYPQPVLDLLRLPAQQTISQLSTEGRNPPEVNILGDEERIIEKGRN